MLEPHTQDCTGKQNQIWICFPGLWAESWSGTSSIGFGSWPRRICRCFCVCSILGGLFRFRKHILPPCQNIFSKYARAMAWSFRPHVGHVRALQEASNANVLLTKRVQKMISGWYSVYPAPSGLACLFDFDWKFGFAKIWWPDKRIGFYLSKTNCPRTSLDDGQLLRASIDTTRSFRCIPISKQAPNPMPEFVNSYLNIPYRIPMYFLQGVA